MCRYVLEAQKILETDRFFRAGITNCGAFILVVRRVSQQLQQSMNEAIITISDSDLQQNTKIPVNLMQFG